MSKSKRLLATIPVDTEKTLKSAARQHGIDHSLIIQQAITRMSKNHPSEKDIHYIRGDTVGVQVSLSDTAFRLLQMWSDQTGLSKSKLITYSLQKTIEERGEF